MVSRGAEKGALNRYLGLLFLYAHSRIVWSFADFEVHSGRESGQHTIIRLDRLRGLARDTAFRQRYETIHEPRDETA